MNAAIPHEGRCNARTRAGGLCRRRPRPPLPRCNLHGGKSLFGIAHPNYKHGLYSKHCPAGRVRRAEAEARRRRRALWRAFYAEVERRGGSVTWPQAFAILRRVCVQTAAEKIRRP